MRIRRQRGKGADGVTDLEEDARSPELVGRDRGTPGGQIRPARELQVERFELSRSLQQQRRRVVAVGQDRSHVTRDQCGSCALEIIERASLGRGQEPESRIKRPNLEAGLGRGQRPLRPPP